jgi:phosphotriesterase-related protein
MALINSVLGPLDTTRLGYTLSHEHIIVASAGIQQSYPEFIDREGTIRDGIAALCEAHTEGVRTIVDCSTVDLGRDVRMLEEVSRGSGVNIIASTGVWRDIPRVFWQVGPEAVARLFIREIEQGIDGTPIKAGIIKVASDREGVTREGDIILRAAAHAQKATGVPITTHTWAPARVGKDQVKVFEEEGVDLNRVYIGHCNDTTDVDYLLQLLEKGVWLGLDRHPGGAARGTPDWEQRSQLAKKLIDAGYGDRIMLSHDWAVNFLLLDEAGREEINRENPDAYLFIMRRVLPRLRELGASDEDFRKIFVENPRNFFEGNPRSR